MNSNNVTLNLLISITDSECNQRKMEQDRRKTIAFTMQELNFLSENLLLH